MQEAKKDTAYMIGNSHIDPVWLWRDCEGLQAARATFASALDRMDEFDEFVFSASSPALYAWVEQHHPNLFARIQQRVQEGRWQLVGGWWIEPDANIPCGESLMRQGLYGQRYFQRAFGRTARTSFNVDSFGHSAGLARLLALQGIDRYVFMRPNPTQWTLPAPVFRWQDEDGSAITACQIQGEYCAWTKTAIVDNLNKSLHAMRQQGLSGYPVFYGVGNHGGGPTIENIKAIRELAQERPDIEFPHTGPDAFFDALQPDALPVYTGELEGIFPGCYTADSELKRLCRQCEEALAQAETLGAMAAPVGFAYPTMQLDEAWKLLLFAQFHDTMAGTARKEARDDACLDMARCLSIAREATGGAMQSLSAAIDTRGDGHPLLLLNTTDHDYHGIVEADIYWYEKHPLRLKNAAGLEISYDNTLYRRVAPGARKRLVFYADVPAFGYALYRMLPETPQIAMPTRLARNNTLESEHLRLTFDTQTGALCSLWDKRHEAELLAGPVTLDIYRDARDTWGASGNIDERLGQYALSDMFLLEDGGIRSTMCVQLQYGRCAATLRYSLGADDAFFTLDGTLDNRETLTLTSLRMPLAPAFDTVTAEMPYAEITRPYGIPGERHCQRYTHLRGKGASLLLVNQAKYAYRVHGGAYETVLSRTPVHAFSAGEMPLPGHLYDYVDTYASLPFALRVHPFGGETKADRIRAAQRLHRPVEVLADSIHSGEMALRAQSFLQMEELDGCVAHLLRQTADGKLVARLENTTDAPREGALRCRHRAYATRIEAGQLAAYALAEAESAKAVPFLEEN